MTPMSILWNEIYKEWSRKHTQKKRGWPYKKKTSEYNVKIQKVKTENCLQTLFCSNYLGRAKIIVNYQLYCKQNCYFKSILICLF